MENNNENVSKNKKSIYIDFNGTTQTIKYYGKFDIESIKKFVKSRFSIEESIEQIFFKDEDDDILVLNKNTPDNIKVYLFILKDLIPKNPSTALKISEIKNENSLLKFHWVLENEESNARFKDCIVDKYIYKNINDDESHPQARSSVTFKKGIHFCVIRVGSFQAYECLRVVDDYSPCIKESWNYKHNTIIGFSFNFESYAYSIKDIWTLDIGILIDMEKKICAFYDYERKKLITIGHDYCPPKIIPMKGKIKSDGVKIIAWLKRGTIKKERGMTILNEGCIPIPDWVKI